MANKFRTKKEEVSTQEKPLKAKKTKPNNDYAAKLPKPKKAKSATRKKIRKGFNTIFGGGILRGINLQKNWFYFLMVTMMIIVLIYNSLNMQSKKVTIEKLKDQIVVANDALMDVIEEGYTIDDMQDKELSEMAKEEGFINKGYIPYIIQKDEDEQR
ncbi:MAG: hypothetical protein LBH82_04170 [Bacteroidales bacterium]|jgi:hypothetical protein|nr:hypothetical protein [Bacteroidales bacterium]